MAFEISLTAGWADMDFNQHMANTAYLQKAVDVRFLLLASHGFNAAECARRQIGPVVQKDEVEYFREVRLHEEIRATFTLAGHSDDGSRWIARNEFFKGDKLSARINTWGGWVDLRERRLIAPPEDLKAAMDSVGRTDDFRVLEPIAG